LKFPAAFRRSEVEVNPDEPQGFSERIKLFVRPMLRTQPSGTR